MRLIKPLGFLAGITLIIACFLPWVYIESGNITVTGLQAKGTSFGKPGMFHIVFAVIYLALLAVPRIWSRRLNMLFTAFNIAWAVRNFMMVSACYGGECPEKKFGLYLVLIASGFMLFTVLFAPERIREDQD